MEMTQPGVTITEDLISQKSNNAFIGTPIFIGYTQPLADKNEHNNIIIKLTSLADFTLLFHNAGLMYYSVCHFFENGGQLAYMLSLGPEVSQKNEQSLLVALQQNWLKHAIAAESKITLIIVPDSVHFNQIGDTDTNIAAWLQLWQSVLNLCKSRRGIMALLDAPDKPELAAQCLARFSSNDRQWGAVYWPRVNSAYQENNQSVRLSPTAAVAAIIQRYDNEQVMWTAPANVSLAKVISPLCSHIKADGLFNQDGTSLNLVRSFPGKGVRIWGCRTLENIPDSPWRYIQIRRLVSYIEDHMTQLGRAFVFEPNNAITWMKFKGHAYNWLRQLWLKGGLRGTQEEHAFEVLLGVNESMSETDLREGKMIMKIRLALLIPAEFIELSLEFDTRTGMIY
ncbi:phage tail sheath family protein [Xenorhabdus bovienii]|uniref:phage tail sheath C-terminal domain-containing protein n=1 Tax=Xenorhabdus bovienii TaxID=40576 RepID=UPI0023B33204|nr:phage tail sheath C-terminal domain-containing protein [Xenorhabdus bovienii]MDE9518072.1 phage tail sheath family protein [Xenorhabdus bovienii]